MLVPVGKVAGVGVLSAGHIECFGEGSSFNSLSEIFGRWLALFASCVVKEKGGVELEERRPYMSNRPPKSDQETPETESFSIAKVSS